MLVHDDLARSLWIDFDESQKFGLGVLLFHIRQIEEEVPEKKWPKRSTVEPILFHSRLLTTAEKNY